MTELRITLTSKQKQFRSAVRDYRIAGYGGAKGGGKSHGLRSLWLIDTLSHPGMIAAIFRRSYPELEDNHIGPLFKQFPELRDYYNGSKHEIRIPQLESELKFRYCSKEGDVYQHQGREYHRLGIEEAGQWTENMFFRLMGSNRSSRDHIRPKAGLTFNPGGVGHRWIKRLFIEKKLKDYELAAGWKKTDIAFVQALVTDNPFLMRNDPDYVKILEAEPNEMLRKAYRYGDWDIQAGQYFGELDRSIHMVKPFPIPRHWHWFGSYDYGYNHPASWGFWVCDEDGNIYRVKEFVLAKKRIDEQASIVNEYLQSMIKTNQKKDKSIIFWAGHDCWAVKKAGDPTIAEDFAKHEIFLKRANIDRKQGASQVRMYLAHEQTSDGKRKGPRVFYFDTCEIGFDCLSRMTHNPNDPEDVLKVDAVDGDPFTGDDSYDEARYGIMSRPSVATTPKKKWHRSYDEFSSERKVNWQTV